MINGFLPGNLRVYNPAIIDSNDVTRIYPPNANLAITGTEKYVNSGWMFPKGHVPGTFSVTLKKQVHTTTYAYFIHGWLEK